MHDCHASMLSSIVTASHMWLLSTWNVTSQKCHVLYVWSTLWIFKDVAWKTDCKRYLSIQFSHCHVQLFATPWTVVRQASLSTTNSQSLLTLMSIETVMSSNHLILCHPLLLLPAIFPSIRVFSKESVLHIRWPEYWSFRFSISSSNEYSGLISFRMEWSDLLAAQGTLKSLLQHQSSKASNLRCWAFLIVQLLNPYIQFSSVSQSCPTLCDPMNHSTPGLHVHLQLPEFTQTHIHWVGDAIQPSHPLSSPSLPALSLSQHQGLF